MNSFQRTMKYIAIAFAIFLSITIISGIASAAFTVINAVTGHNNFKGKNTIDFSETFQDVESLHIENSAGKLLIKTGDSFLVEAENVSEDFTARVSAGGTLTISDSKNFGFLWFRLNGFHNPNARITIYLPEDFVAKETKIDTGAGAVTVEGLHSKRLTLSTGAGSINGRDLTADKVKIDGGVGSITFKDVVFTDADFDCGVGSFDIEGVLLGKNKIDCGVGEVKLDLVGNVDDYDIDVDTGLGSVRLNGVKISKDYETDYNADHSLKIDSGVGDVRININQ